MCYGFKICSERSLCNERPLDYVCYKVIIKMKLDVSSKRNNRPTA